MPERLLLHGWESLAKVLALYFKDPNRTKGNWLYLAILFAINLVNLTVLLPLLIVFVRRRCSHISEALWGRPSVLEDTSVIADSTGSSCSRDAPTIVVVVPCYMPNEQDVIEETINHILENLQSPGHLELWVVYNTPEDLPEIEGRLRDLQDRPNLPHGRTLKVMREEGSTSKAENLNAVIAMLKKPTMGDDDVPYVAFYDADHHPDPTSLVTLYEKLHRDGLDCVQGSIYIRNLCAGIRGHLINAEFFLSHFMFFPAMKLYTGQAFFCGSNALWKREALIHNVFDHGMQTEDIDISVRAQMNHHRIDFCPEARSGELAPSSLDALCQQRLRWAVGWDQVSFKYSHEVMFSSVLPFFTRFGLFHVLVMRWLLLLAGVFVGVAVPVLDLGAQHQKHDIMIHLMQRSLLVDFCIVVVCCILEAIFQSQHRGWQSLTHVFYVAVYLSLSAPCVALQTILVCVSLFKVTTGRVGTWVVTARSTKSMAS